MNARFGRTVVSVAAVVATVSCTHFIEIPIETPIKPKLDVSAFQRVLVAGFIAGGIEDVDANVVRAGIASREAEGTERGGGTLCGVAERGNHESLV